jgi:hypothetical protein
MHMKKMIRFRVLSILFLLAIAMPMLSTSAQPGSEGGDEIKWTSNFRLTWAHFKGRPDRLNPMDALTESGITFNWSCDSRGFSYEAYALFVPSGSWVKDPTQELLSHEQGHFDITEIHARKLRKYLTELGNPCRLGKTNIDKVARGIMDASQQMQNTYDEATNHGENDRMQKQWLTKINEELVALEEFAL